MGSEHPACIVYTQTGLLNTQQGLVLNGSALGVLLASTSWVCFHVITHFLLL